MISTLCKKSLFSMVCLLQVLSLGAQQFDVQAQASKGEKRVFQVMYQGFGGLQHVHRKIACAETKNLVSDLNIVELSKQFGCKTKMGQAYIAFVLERVVSTKIIPMRLRSGKR